MFGGSAGCRPPGYASKTAESVFTSRGSGGFLEVGAAGARRERIPAAAGSIVGSSKDEGVVRRSHATMAFHDGLSRVKRVFCRRKATPYRDKYLAGVRARNVGCIRCVLSMPFVQDTANADK